MTPPETPATVSITYERALRTFLRTRGLRVHAPDELDDSPARRVSGQAFGTALTDSGHRLGEAGLGLVFGATVGGAGFGLLGVAAATAPTLRHSMRQLQRFEALTSTLGHLQIRDEGACTSLVWRPAGGPAVPAVAEAILAGWVSFGRYLLNEQVDVREVGFAHAAAAPGRVYDDTLACPTRFQTSEYRVTVQSELLDAPSRFAEPTVSAALDAWLDRCTLASAVAPQAARLSCRVAALLGARLALVEANEATVAAALGMERWTLQRRLAAEGTGFRGLLDAARAQHAIVGVLRGRTPLAQLSLDVGFDEQSSLCRAFKRWTGHAPVALRGQLQPMFAELRT